MIDCDLYRNLGLQGNQPTHGFNPYQNNAILASCPQQPPSKLDQAKAYLKQAAERHPEWRVVKQTYTNPK